MYKRIKHFVIKAYKLIYIVYNIRLSTYKQRNIMVCSTDPALLAKSGVKIWECGINYTKNLHGRSK